MNMSLSITILCFLCLLMPYGVFADGMWKSYLSSEVPGIENIYSIAADEDGVFWCCPTSADYGVFRFEGGGWREITREDGLADNAVNDIAVAPNGDVWFATKSGLSRFDGADWTTYTVVDGLVSDDVLCIHFTSDGVLWCGTRDAGVSMFDGVDWISYDKGDGLCSNHILVIDSAPNGDVWFGSFQSGASCFDGERWRTYVKTDGLVFNSVLALAVDHDGNVWFGVHDYPYTPSEGKLSAQAGPSGMFPAAVSMFDGERWTIYTYLDGLAADWVWDIDVAPNGDIWFATAGESGFGVSRLRGGTMTIFTTADGLAGNQVHSVHAGPDGTIYLGTTRGLSVFTELDNVSVEGHDVIPDGVRIVGNSPNPFNPSTVIEFVLPEDGLMKAEVYNAVGQKVKTLFTGFHRAGTHRLAWDSTDDSGMTAAAGVYVCRIASGRYSDVIKMLLIR